MTTGVATAAVGLLAGAVVGAVVGGLAGRVEMRLIAVWTEPLTSVTLTGNRVGAITLDGTLSLMASTA